MESKKTLIIGASTKRMRYSNMAIRRLLEHGHSVIGIGKSGGSVMGVEVSSDKSFHDDIHTVSLYVNSSIQPEFYNYIVSLRPNRVIFNPGTENSEFYDILKENDIGVEIACTLVLLRTNQY